ncbi:unnamed protein product [Sphagnum tenellum]
MSVNKVILVGRLGQTPEVRYTPSGSAVGNFSIATNENWMDKTGQKQEKTEWHRIVVWGKTAENCSQFLSKGRQVYVEGRLQTRQWQDKDGQTKYSTEVIAQTVQFLGGNQGAGSNAPGATSGDRYAPGGNMMSNPPMDDLSSAGGFGGPNSFGGPGSSNGGGGGMPLGGASLSGGNGGPLGGPNSASGSGYGQPSRSSGNMEPSFTEDDIPF